MVPTPPRKTTLILVQRKDKHASDHRRRQMQHTHLQSGKEEKESSGSHPEMMFLIGFRRYEGYRYMGGIQHWPQRLASLECERGPLSHFLQAHSHVGMPQPRGICLLRQDV